jgi:uncharacterized protein (DUF362 family)
MLNRREILKSATALSGLGMLGLPQTSAHALAQTEELYGVHPFVWSHPEAVFIMRTRVDIKTNATAKVSAGRDFADRIFLPGVPSGMGGIPLGNRVAIKPNLTGSDETGDEDPKFLEQIMGMFTDVNFVEGMILGMQGLGIPGSQFYIREMNGPLQQGYPKMAERVGADIRTFGGFNSNAIHTLDPGDIVWKDVPDGRAVLRYPYLWPINAPDTLCLNVSKFKTHSMGMTLCAKNFQGALVSPYQHFCHKERGLIQMRSSDLNPQVMKHYKADFERHISEGVIPRWDKPKDSDHYCPWTLDTWATRTLDSLSASNIGLHIVEGIYGRDGNGFREGPHGGLAKDYMTNVVIFGMDPILVDIVGHWMGGHEPGNFGFFHVAMERGISELIDPRKIPVYSWENETAKRILFKNLPRTSLVTRYLQNNYNDGSESEYHLMDQPFDYSCVQESQSLMPAEPASTVLYHSGPQARRPHICIEYRLPRSGEARLDIYNERGECVAVPVEGKQEAGAHLAVWNIEGVASGNYQYRFRTNEYSVQGDLYVV